jgi:hypothetical protein
MKRVVRLTESQLRDLISSTVKKNKQINEYSEGFMGKVVERFKREATSEIEDYVMRFQEISSNLKKRDLNMYSWEELKQTVDSYKNKSHRDAISYVEKNADKFNTDYGYDKYDNSYFDGDNYMRDYMKNTILDKHSFKNRNK